MVILEEKLEARTYGLASEPQTPNPFDFRAKIIEYNSYLGRQGFKPATILSRTKLIRVLVKRGADLYNPDSVKSVIARQEKWCDGRKENAVQAYSLFLKMTGGKWDPPIYRRISKIAFFPIRSEIEQFIADLSPRMGTFYQLLYETGMRPGEAWQLEWKDIDTKRKKVSITPEKHSNPRILPLSRPLIERLEALPRNYGNRIFSTPTMDLNHFRGNFDEQRAHTAQKNKNSRLLQMTFKTMRYYKSTLEYRHHGIVEAMHLLGHKNLTHVMTYIHRGKEMFPDEQQRESALARNAKEACKLVDLGYDYVTGEYNDGGKIFSRPKNDT